MVDLRKHFESLKSKEFEEVYKNGKKIVTPFFVLFILKGKPRLKVGVVASKKIGKAVKRNRVKRRLREIIRLSQPYLPNNIWIVLIARRYAINFNFNTMKKTFETIIKNETNITVDS